MSGTACLRAVLLEPTPGPWQPNRTKTAAYTADHDLIAHVGLEKQDEANLRLICQAPEMYDLIDTLVHCSERLLLSPAFCEHDGPAYLARMREILAAVNGETAHGE